MEHVTEAIVLTTRPYEEKNTILSLFMSNYGRYVGFARSVYTTRMRDVLQPGNLVHAIWRGRLAEHLGTLSCELLCGNAAHLFLDIKRLICLTSAYSMMEAVLPERVPYPVVFATDVD